MKIRFAMLAAACLALCCCMSWPTHAQNTTGELFNMCDLFERGARISGTSVALPNTDAAQCFSYFTAIHQLTYFHINNNPKGMLQVVCPPSPNGPTITQFIRVLWSAHAPIRRGIIFHLSTRC